MKKLQWSNTIANHKVSNTGLVTNPKGYIVRYHFDHNNTIQVKIAGQYHGVRELAEKEHGKLGELACEQIAREHS